MDVTPQEMKDLAALTVTPGYPVLKRMLAKMVEGARADLESVDTPLDTVRGLQGRLGVAASVSQLLDEGVPTWVAAMSETKEN